MQCCCSASRPPRGCCLALGAVGEVVTKVRRASVDAAAAVPALEVGAAMEVQGCGEDCDFVCSECAWEACRIVADHGDLCAVRITSDGELCAGVQRRHVRPMARVVQKRAAVAATQPSKRVRRMCLLSRAEQVRTREARVV